MSHKIRVRFDPTTVPSDIDSRISNWESQFNPILTDQNQGYRLVEDTSNRDKYGEVVRRFDIRDTVTNIVDALVSDFSDVSGWMLVETAVDELEWDIDTFANDASYYDPNKTDGHRTPPNLTREGLYDIGVGEVNYLISGTEYSASGTSFTVDPPTDTPRTDYIIATDSSEIQLETGVTESDLPSNSVVVGTLETHPGKVVDIDAKEVGVTTSDYTIAHEKNSVPAPLTGGSDPSLSITGDTIVLNDGTDTANIDITTDAQTAHDATLSIDGDDYLISLDPTQAHTETITTAEESGYLIDISITGAWPTNKDTHTIEVQSA